MRKDIQVKGCFPFADDECFITPDGNHCEILSDPLFRLRLDTDLAPFSRIVIQLMLAGF